MIGQSIGAKRSDLTRRFAWITTGSGMVMMGLTAMLMYAAAPTVLRLELIAEPFFAASIVALGVFRGMGDTLVPSLMNLMSMWAVRITLSAYLAPRMGLKGAWIAMTIELFFRGTVFLIRLYKKNKTRNM